MRIETILHLSQKLIPLDIANVVAKYDYYSLEESIIYLNIANVTCMCSIPYSSNIVLGFNNGNLKIYNLISKTFKDLPGHTDKVTVICAISNLIISGGYDNIIRIWNNSVSIELKGHTNFITSICIKKDFLISGSWDTTIKVWYNTQCIMTLVGHKQPISCVSILSNNIIISSDGLDLHIWKDFQLYKIIPDRLGILKIISVGKNLIAINTVSRSLGIFDLEDILYTTILCGVGLNSIDSLSNGYIVILSTDGQLRIYDTVNYKCISLMDGVSGNIISILNLASGFKVIIT